MKKFWIPLIALTVILLAGCASWNFQPLIDVTGGYINSDVSMVRTGSATSRTILGWWFGEETFPTVDRVASENGITRIATVQHIVRPGVLFLWTDWTTIVTGE